MNRSRLAAVLAAVGFFVLAVSGRLEAQTIRPDLYVTNGPVNAVALSGNTLYIGGDFTQVGPATGGGVPIDATSGAPRSGFPKVVGSVMAVAGDGSGGWYIGGKFSSVGGLPRENLAHILSDNSVSGWNPSANAEVHALALAGTSLYVGGDFTGVGGQVRSRIASLDLTTGLATPWSADANGAVETLAVSGETIYVGGSFTTIGIVPRNRAAAIDIGTGEVTSWNPNASGSVMTIAFWGTTVYLGGTFTRIGDVDRHFLVGVDDVTGAFTGWSPNPNSEVLGIAVKDSTVYACGRFTIIGGQSRMFLAALRANGASATTWDPNPMLDVTDISVSGQLVYVGGRFTSINGHTRSHLAAIDAGTGHVTEWNPSSSGPVSALWADGSVVYVGGSFASIGGQARNYLAAIDVATGLPTDWNPNANFSVYALAVNGSSVYVGGAFFVVGGQSRNKIAELDAMTGLATAWNPSADGYVSALAVSGSTIYAGGGFDTIGGQTRSSIAALDATNGLVSAWNPNIDAGVYALAVSGSVVYAGGTFSRVGGEFRRSLIALDVATGLATSWDPSPSTTVHALCISEGVLYVGGEFVAIGGQSRGHLASFSTATGLLTEWNPIANDRVRALAVGGATVYAGGMFSAVGGQSRNHIAALDATTGLATAWEANAGDEVLAIAVGGRTVYAGGVFRSMGALPQSGIAAASIPYTLSTASNPPTGGSVTKSPHQLTYEHGTPVTLTATPVVNYSFDSWDGLITPPDGSPTSNPVTIEMTSPRTITARFSRRPSNIAELTGEVAGDDFYVASDAGDVNGDGFDDVIVGAAANDAGGLNAGRAYVYFGGRAMNTVPDVVLTGEAAGDAFGVSCSGAGDVNGDGFDDVIVGAYNNDAGGANAGRAYVFFGGGAMDATADVVLTGESAGDSFGHVHGAGDVNHDGFDDLIVGAYNNDAAGTNAGRAYVFFGGPGMDTVADVVMTGAAAGDLFGLVSSAGDLNGDGYDDVIVGAIYNDGSGTDAGRAYVYFGGPAMDAIADLLLTGEAPYDYFGNSVSGAGDVNGDGFDDVIVGAMYNDAGAADAGRAYVYYGGAVPDAIPDLTFTGAAASDYFGRASGAGDINRDGYADLIVGARGSDALGTNSGRAYIYYGGPAADATADMTLDAAAAGDEFGGMVSSAGDVNADGFADAIVGARFNDAGGNNAGRAYIVALDQAPYMVAPKNVSGEEGGTITFTLVPVDPDGDAVTMSWFDLSGLPSDGDATLQSGVPPGGATFLWHPAVGHAGDYIFPFWVENTSRTTDTTRIHVAAFGTSIDGALTWKPTSADVGLYEVKFTAHKKGAPASEKDSVTTLVEIVAEPTKGARATPAVSLAPAAALKGPIVSAPLTAQASVGGTLVVEVSATDADSLWADLTNLPPGNTATFTVDREPDLEAPAAMNWDAGSGPIEFAVVATDPDGDAIGTLSADLSGLPAGNTATFAVAPGNGSGTFSWLPSVTNAGVYVVNFTAANLLVRRAATAITVGAQLGGYWRMNGNLLDAALNHNLTAVGNVAYAAGVLSGAVEIDGASGSYLEGTSSSYSNVVPSGSTVELWVKIRSLAYGENPMIMEAGDEQGGNDYWKLYLAGSGVAAGRVRLIVADPPASWALQSPASIDDGAWHHVAFTYDWVRLRLYIDGVRVASVIDSSVYARTENTPLRLGRYWTASPALDQFDGWLDEVRHWSVARSQAQIQADMVRELGFPTAAEESEAPRYVYRMAQNRPNPFNPATTIEFELEQAGGVSLAILDVQGRLVRNLAEGPRSAGRHVVRWDGVDGQGRSVASGVYFYRLRTPGFSATRRMVLLR